MDKVRICWCGWPKKMKKDTSHVILNHREQTICCCNEQTPTCKLNLVVVSYLEEYNELSKR